MMPFAVTNTRMALTNLRWIYHRRNIYPNAPPTLRIALIYPAEVLARFSLEVEIHRTAEMERASCVEAG